MINIDGAGDRHGATAYSTYGSSSEMSDLIDECMGRFPQLVRGPEWYQSDHAIFAMRGRPALAFTSERLDRMLAEVYHAPTDSHDQVATARLIEIARAITELAVRWRVTSQA